MRVIDMNIKVSLGIQSEYGKIRTRKNSVLGNLSTVFLLLQVSWSNMPSSSIFHALTGSDFTMIFYRRSKIQSLKKVISASNDKINTSFIFQESYYYTSNWFYHCVKSVQIRTSFWSLFSRISIECGGLWSKSMYMDTFDAVYPIYSHKIGHFSCTS